MDTEAPTVFAKFYTGRMVESMAELTPGSGVTAAGHGRSKDDGQRRTLTALRQGQDPTYKRGKGCIINGFGENVARTCFKRGLDRVPIV